MADANSPETIWGELIEEIAYGLANQPRNLQKRIGPSEIGEECNRALIGKLMEQPDPEEGEKPNYRAWVGTCMHVGLESIFSSSVMQQAQAGPRFLIEKLVHVGTIGDWPLIGKCDLFDTATGTVIDWKTKSMTQHELARKHGMGQKYRVQAQCYAHGMALKGYQVRQTMLGFLLRDGELNDAFQLSEPYDPQVAIDALDRANQLYALATMFGVETAQSMYPPCEGPYCRLCGNYRAPYAQPRAAAPTTIAEAIAAATTKGIKKDHVSTR